MAEPASLGDFFAKKKKKTVKASNLNNATATAKPEAKKAKTKDAEEDGWEEEPVEVQTMTMKVEIAGKLTREEEKKDDDDASAPAWKPQKTVGDQQLNDRKFPTLAKSVQSSNINIDDGSEPKVNIQTSKNMFASLGNADDDEDEPKRPKEIKPAMVQKKKGESEKVAIQREVDKYSTKKKDGKDSSSKSTAAAREDDESDEDEEKAEEGAQEAPETKSKKKQEEKREAKKAVEAEVEEKEVEADVRIKEDLEAAKAKYSGRKKLAPTKLPAKELQEEKKEAKPKPVGKKKMAAMFEEEDKKLPVWED